MATSLASSLTVILKTTLKSTGVDLSVPEDVMTKAITDILADGVALDQADVVYHDKATLNNNTRTIDVHTSATEEDPWGLAITMAKIKCVFLHNLNTAAGEYIELGGVANAPVVFTSSAPAAEFPIHTVHPGGILLVWNPSLAGWAVANNTGDVLELDTTGSGASVDYEIVIIGTST